MSYATSGLGFIYNRKHLAINLFSEYANINNYLNQEPKIEYDYY